MSYLRCSQNYVWPTTSVLGKGATAVVYQGVNKINGESVAVKTFNQISQLRPQEVQMREFEVLQRVNHENIVKLIAIEDEQENRGKVIVMELCTGGSLFNILDDPENTYGVEESEFLLVLEHLTAGMKHLRDNNLIHRDLKPGNIMKFIRNDGKTIYKLTDFGAARELKEDQYFQSLYGTEEYLHPDLYERAVLKKPANKSFGATIDLWSIGVTLYHTATGNLPFRPHDGRKNRETMYRITTKKASGVISGIQTQKDGEILWKNELPDNCQLSAGLKKFLTPLLAGLLEADSKKIWSFERFFQQVQELLIRIPLNIFYINNSNLIKIYIHPDDTMNNLLNLINEQTNILNENQILLYENKLLNEVINDNIRACAYPKTKETEPFLLFNNHNNNIKRLNDEILPIFDGFADENSIENDAVQAKIACSISYLYKRKIEKLSLNCQLIYYTIDNFIKYINENLKKLNKECDQLLERLKQFNKILQILKLSQQLVNKLNLNITTINVDTKQLSNTFQMDVNKTIKQLYQTYINENQLKLEWEQYNKDLNCPNRACAKEKAKTFVEQQRESWQHLVRDRATRNLTYNDGQFHILERIKITQTIDNLQLLLNDIKKEFTKFCDTFGDWYNFAQAIYLKMIIFTKEVINYKQQLQQLELDFTIKYDDYSEEIQRLLIDEHGNELSRKNNKDLLSKKLKSSLNDYKLKNNDFHERIYDNSKLVNELNKLLENFNFEHNENC